MANIIKIWVLVMFLLIGASLAISGPHNFDTSVGVSSPGNGEVSSTHQHDERKVLGSLRTVAMRIWSIQLGREKLHWPELEWNWRLILAMVLGTLGASMCSAGGVGGGGLFIPLFNLLIGFDAKSAAALSNFMIFGGSLANVGWNILRDHPFLPGHPLIDFDVALLLQPNMLLGISIGVICNIAFPSWFITLEFIVTLGYITARSFRSGLVRWSNETRLAEEAAKKTDLTFHDQERGQTHLVQTRSSTFDVLTGCVLEESEAATSEALERLDSKQSWQNLCPKEGNEANVPLLGQFKAQRNFPYVKLLMLTLVWVAFLAIQLLRGGKSSNGILTLEPCGGTYWLLTTMQVPIAFLLTGWSTWHLHHALEEKNSPELQLEEWDVIGPRAFVLFPSMALLAGFLGGMLGIGGGMIINPMLMELGMHPQLTAATTAFMVLFSSSLSVVQFWLLGRLQLDFALLFGAICFVSSLIGLHVIQQAVAKFGRPSIIVFSVSIVLGISAVSTTFCGGFQVWDQFISGEYMGFHYPC